MEEGEREREREREGKKGANSERVKNCHLNFHKKKIIFNSIY